MKKILLSALFAAGIAGTTEAQIKFDPSIDTAWAPTEAKLPQSPLKTQVLFIGGYDMVQTTDVYGNNAGEALAKQWHDFIGITPDNSGSGDLGWVTVSHEMVTSNDSIGDGGGMTVFKIKRDPNTDSLIIVDQTLADGRSGKFFNVDFVSTVGETGMNCGGIVSPDGRVWTAEEWWQSNLASTFRDTVDFIIGTTAPAGFPGFNGQTIDRVENLNYMVEIDPKQAKAVRKQYNWGRQPFEGGVVMADNKTVYLGADNTPAIFSKFVANTAGDFTTGTTYAYKHDASGGNWIQMDNTNLTEMLNFTDSAIVRGATMFNRLEWVTKSGGKVYFTETGRANPGSRWAGSLANGGVFAPHHITRATAQGTTPDATAYEDYYGRVLVYDPTTDDVTVHLEGGPDFATSPAVNAYPAVHLSNPDGIGTITINGQDYLLIQEDLNQTDHGSMPAGKGTTCEMYMLDASITSPTLNDLKRLVVGPEGAEITGAVGTADGKTILVNIQHPNSTHPFPYNNSVTLAITGFDENTVSNLEYEMSNNFSVYPNPTTRMLNFSRPSDVAVYDNQGKRIRVYRGQASIDVSYLTPGVYFIQNDEGQTMRFIVE